MTQARVRFKRYELTLHISNSSYSTNGGIGFTSKELETAEGVVLGFVVKEVGTPFYYKDNEMHVPTGTSSKEVKTLAIIGCDDGKVEERVLESVEYLPCSET
jgi:hypothetical protein